MHITIGGKPLRFSKYEHIYKDLLSQPIAAPIDAETGWIHLSELDKAEAKKIYEAVRRRILKNCTGERLQSSKAKGVKGEIILSLRRVAVSQQVS